MRHLPLILLVAWAAAIFVASSIPNPPDAGGDEWKYEAAHLFEYAVFGALAALTLRAYFPLRPLMFVTVAAWTLAIAYGVSDEFHQSFVRNRDANIVDVIFDAAGAIIGIALVVRFSGRFREGSRAEAAQP